MAEKYIPSNGSECEWFMDRFCDRCAKCPEDPDADGQCDILCRALIHDVDEPEYPPEWCYDENEWPACTAFALRDGEEHHAEVLREKQAALEANGQMRMEL